jgi:uncharacterized cupin superfamily protein
VPNVNDANFDERPGSPPGFRSKRARIGYELGSELVGASLWLLPPGEAACPYHYHYADEEIMVVLKGRPSLRTPEGVRELEQGEVVRFPLGPDGAHQLFNPGEEEARILAVSSHGRPDIVVYPDSGKVSVSERQPDGSGFREYFKLADRADYWEGEAPPSRGSD